MQARTASTTIAAARPVGRFALEFLQMCAAMCIGGAILSIAVFQAAAFLGYPRLAQDYPEVAMVILGFTWAIAMGTFMAVRRHPWPHNLEMSSTSVVVGVLFALASASGLVHIDTPLGWGSLFIAMCGPACGLMLVDMLFRFNHYTGAHGGHADMPSHEAHTG